MQAPPSVDMAANNQVIDQLQSQVAYMTSELANHQAQGAAQSAEIARLLDEIARFKANSDTVNVVCNACALLLVVPYPTHRNRILTPDP
jgi:hypothetical protein